MHAELIQFEKLQIGDRVTGIVCAWSCDAARTRADKPYLRMELRDINATLIPAISWDTEHDRAPDCPAAVYIEGEVSTFQGSPQIKVFGFELTDFDIELFVPTTYRPIAQLSDEFDGLIELIQDEAVRELVRRCFDSAPGFWSAPAAINFHGAYRGGLLEHTLNVTRVCLNAADIYGDRVDQDLLLAGAMLHDIGKADAYDSPERREPIENERLVGHIVRGAMLVERTAEEIAYAGHIPVADIVHMIVSHHGELEFGAPIKPSTAEALILSAADTLEADATGYFDQWRDNSDGKSWAFSRQRGGWVRRPSEARSSSTAFSSDSGDDLPF